MMRIVALVAVLAASEQAAATTPKTWDSSAFSPATDSSKPLGSLSSGSSDAGASSAPDLSGSGAISGFGLSGSSGLFLRVWHWILIVALFLLVVGAVYKLACGKKKAKKTKKKAVPAAAPAPAAEQVDVAPLLLPMMPLATSSTLIPSYSMVQQPQYQQQYQQYAAPATTSYAAPMQYAAPATTSYAAPQVQYQQYAAPATTSYAAPMSMGTMQYAAPAGYAQPAYGMQPAYAGGSVV